MEPVTVTIRGAREALGLGHTKIYQLIGAGALKTVKVGRRTLVRTDSIRALVDQAA
jgi:excisionase family DNA binding protein